MTDYAKKTSDAIVGKKVKTMEIDGHGVRIGCGDGTVLDYHASDGGYSLWHVTLPNGRVVG